MSVIGRDGDERPKKAGPISNVVCPGCKRSLDDVIESMIRQRGKFKGQREEARDALREIRTIALDLDNYTGGEACAAIVAIVDRTIGGR